MRHYAGTVWTWLNSFRIPPVKFTAHLSHQTTARWQNTPQEFNPDSRDTIRVSVLGKTGGPVTITLELPPEIEAHFVAEAKAQGMSVEDVVKAYLLRQRVQSDAIQMSPEEWDAAWDELLDSLPNIPTLPDEAISRESIYTREDE